MRISSVLLLHTVMFTLSGCGLKSGGCAFNDLAPEGTIVAKGSFTGLSKTVTGIATVYRLTADSTYAIRIEGVSIPSEAGLKIRGTATPVSGGASAVAYDNTVRGYCGTQNYFSTISDNRTWSQVAIFSPGANVDYGVAQLQ